jgi:5,10-methylenetetrahydromethanopterin reductase
MKLGLIFPGGGMKIRDMVTIGKEAEGAGFDSLYVTEAWRSGFVPLTALAMATQRVRLGPYVLNAYGRSPLLAGMSAIDLDELSGGRLLLGVGSGNRHINEDWQGVPHVEPYQKMKEYIECLRQIVRTRIGTPMTYEGKIHRMRWTPAVDPLRESIPIYLSAIFPRMVRVAGQVADGVAIGAMGSADYLRTVLQPRVREAATQAGRLSE